MTRMPNCIYMTQFAIYINKNHGFHCDNTNLKITGNTPFGATLTVPYQAFDSLQLILALYPQMSYRDLNIVD